MRYRPKPQFEHLKPQMEQLHREGLSYTKIGKLLGISHKTVSKTLNPAQREKHRIQNKEYYHKYIKKTPLTEEQVVIQKFTSRCKRAISQSRATSKLKGYLPCNATVKDLVDSFIGACHICGVAEAKLDRKLCADHCHDTGKFRGWLCHRCNTGLGYLENNINKAITYLEKTKG